MQQAATICVDTTMSYHLPSVPSSTSSLKSCLFASKGVRVPDEDVVLRMRKSARVRTRRLAVGNITVIMIYFGQYLYRPVAGL